MNIDPKVPTVLPTALPTVCPPGMFFEDRGRGASPFFARWRDAGKKRSKAFKTASARAKFAHQWAASRTLGLPTVPTAGPRELETWKTFDRMTAGANPIEVARFWIKHHAAGLDRLSVSEAIKRFLKLRDGLKISSDSTSHMLLHVTRLAEAVGCSTQLGALDSDAIRAALASLLDPETGEPFSAVTLRHHLRSWRCMMDTARAERWIVHNPCDAVTPPQGDSEERDESGEGGDDPVNILTVEQASHFFAVNRDSLAIGRLALEAFGGTRYTSAARIKMESIKFDSLGIVFPGKAHKSTNRHFVQGWPDNLFAWLKHAPTACWEVKKRQYLELKRAAFVRAGLKPAAPADGLKWSDAELAQFAAMKNVFRHSFATYHLAAEDDPPLTLKLLTKTSLVSLKNDYQGRATEEDGKRYLGILPG